MKKTEQRALRTAAALGVDHALSAMAHSQRELRLRPVAERLNRTLPAGGVALIVGPSGGGKSTLLRLLSDGAVTARPIDRRRAKNVVASLGGRTSLAEWLRLLAQFGLAEARVLLTRVESLSAGERARLELAISAARCERAPGATLVVDEWCSLLDRPTAASVVISAARWARRRGVRLIGATAHDDLVAVLAADVIVRIDQQGGVEWSGYGLNAAG